MPKTLVIAEKPSVAADLARVLGKFTKKPEYFENDDYVICSAVGHLLELAPPDGSEPARGKWKIENLPSLPPKFDLVPIEKNKGRLKTIKQLINRKDIGEIVNACDAGREGELIFRNIVRECRAKQPLKRLWLQSMTPDAIRAAFQRLRSDQDMLPLASAAVSRSEADWLVGINSTRALTAFNSQHGGFQKTTAGRVQTPTLAILAEREERIRNFTARTYFEVFADFVVEAGEYRGRWFDPAFKKATANDEDARAERLWEKERAEAIKAKCEGKPGTIEEEKKPTTQAPPLLYDLTSLQREANQRHGFPARMTLQIAQALYEKHKVLTYPRTDSRYLPEDYIEPAKRAMSSLEDPTLAPHAQRALNEGMVRPNKRIFNNAKVSDHFAIVPTGAVPKNLDEKEQKIFDMVARRFVAVFFPAAQFEVTTRITTVEGEKFRSDGKIIIDPGWLAVYGRQAETDEEKDKAICPVKPGEKAGTFGERFLVSSELANTEAVEVKESQTKPPPRFTEATLLSAMEGAGKFVDDEELREAMSERGLGTPATRAQIIEGLLFEGYIIRQGRELFVTAKGLSLITLLRSIDAEALTKPELTGEWEWKLRKMESGAFERDDFMAEIRALTTDIVEKVRNHMGREVHGRFQPIDVPCPRCGKGPFQETFRAFECSNPECKLIVWKTMADREFEREEIATLLREGKVGPVEGFRSKFGKPFAAVVVLNEKTEWKQKFDFGDGAGGGEGESNGESSAPVNPEPIVACRSCGKGQVFEHAAAYVCDQVASKKCKFRMGKQILQQPVIREQVVKLHTTGKTDLLPKFISNKTKRAFAAHLVLQDGGKVTFEFAPREKKEAGTKASSRTKSTAKPKAGATAKSGKASGVEPVEESDSEASPFNE